MRKEQQTLQGQMPRTEGTFTIFSKIVLSDDLDTCFKKAFVQFRYFQVGEINKLWGYETLGLSGSLPSTCYLSNPNY